MAVVVMILSLATFPPGERAAAQSGSAPESKIAGGIVSLPSTQGWIGEWTIAQVKVSVTASTKIEGKPQVGAWVEASGTRQSSGVFNATKIEIKYAPVSAAQLNFVGRIEELPSTPGRIGPWKIGTRTVNVNDMTKIDQKLGAPAVGANAAVIARIEQDNSLTALSVGILPEFGPPTTIRIVGKVEKLPNPIKPGEWVISGRTVLVANETVIDEQRAKAMIGSLVEVTGSLTSGGKFAATRIEVKAEIQVPTLPVMLRGTIETLPSTSNFIGDWKVSGRTIKVSAETKIDGDKSKLVVGAQVEVRGTTDQTGAVIATSIAVIGAEPTPGYVRFAGEIRSIEPTSTSGSTPSLIGTWKVGERTVRVVAETKIDQGNASAKVGAIAEVEGIIQADGSILAKEIEIRAGTGGSISYTRFYGTIETLPNGSTLVGTWVVSGRPVTVSSRTRIVREHGTPQVGAYVQVEGNQRTDGGVDAFAIQVERDKDAPAGAIGFINFYGDIKTLPAAVAGKYPGEWTIGKNSRKVNVNEATKTETQRGEIKVGAFVEVKGYLFADGVVTALSISVRPTPPVTAPINDLSIIEFIARVSDLPETANFIGQWVFDNGRKVNVSRSTLIDRQRSRIEVGALAEVVGAELPGGEVDAKFIEVEAGSTGATFMQFQPLASVNAGSYLTSNSSSSIIAAFGSNLTTTTASANIQPLPTTLGGVSVMVDGRAAGLFFASPTQINYLVPDEVLPGTAMVTVMRDGQAVAQGTIEISAAAPSLFTADGSGKGNPAGQLLRVKASGQTSYEPLARYDSATSRILPVTITRQSGDRLFLVLYGTGLRGLEDLDGNPANGVAELVDASIGTTTLNVGYAGPAPGFSGLDQFNVELPANISSGTLTITIKVRNGEGSVTRSNEVTISVR